MLTFLGFASLALTAAGARALPPGETPARTSAQFSCGGPFAALFAPPRPQWGRYEVCVTPAPLGTVADPAWPREETGPIDALGAGGNYDRAAVARLYGALKPVVARGWTVRHGALESVTMISPYPDPTATHLESGTLIIRLIICCL